MPTRRELFLDRAGIFGSGSSQNFGPDGFSAIVGGAGLVMSSSGEHNVLAGGHDNTISAGDDNSIVGGHTNSLTSSGANNVIVGGESLSISGAGATNSAVVGGDSNTITSGGANNVIAGGELNGIAAGSHHFAAGGTLLTPGAGIGSRYNATVGGSDNTINAEAGWWNFIGGGTGNVIGPTTSANSNAIVGGTGNTIQANGDSAIVAGNGNVIISGNAAIAGGFQNTVESPRSLVTGSNHYLRGTGLTWSFAAGYLNTIGGFGSTHFLHRNFVTGYNNIIGATLQTLDATIMGYSSTIDGSSNSVIIGGKDHTMAGSSFYRGIFAGQDNEITSSAGNSCTIVGGLRNTISGGRQGGIMASRDTTNNHDRAAMISCDNRTSVQSGTLHVNNLHVFAGYISFAGLPTSSSGLAAGRLWVSGSGSSKYVRMA